MLSHKAFTLIELLVVIAIIAILAVVVVLTLNPAQLLAQSRDANRVSDMATLQSAINLYTTDQSGSLNLGNVSSTYISVPDPNASTTCGSLGMPSLSTSTGQYWTCASSANYRLATTTGWLGINFNTISAGSPFGSLPVDPTNQTSTGLFYAYNTNGSTFQVTADLESTKYKSQYGTNPATTMFPEVISGGTPGISALYNPTGVVGYWPFNEGNGSTTIDQSGNGNNGAWSGSSINGSHYATGKVGSYAGNFNGSNDWVITPLDVQPTALPQTTWTAWIYNASNSGYHTIFGDDAGGFGRDLEVTRGDGNFHVFTNTGGGTWIPASSTVNQWQFVVVEYTPTNVYFYENGVQYFLGSAPNNPSSTFKFYIGTDPANTGEAFNGSIDDVRVYNRALSPAEIMALYNAEK